MSNVEAAVELAEELFLDGDVDKEDALRAAKFGLDSFIKWFMSPERVAVRQKRRQRRRELRKERRAIRRKQ